MHISTLNKNQKVWLWCISLLDFVISLNSAALFLQMICAGSRTDHFCVCCLCVHGCLQMCRHADICCYRSCSRRRWRLCESLFLSLQNLFDTCWHDGFGLNYKHWEHWSPTGTRSSLLSLLVFLQPARPAVLTGDKANGVTLTCPSPPASSPSSSFVRYIQYIHSPPSAHVQTISASLF